MGVCNWGAFDPQHLKPDLVPGNLLNSLMGSGEEEEGEEVQEDGSPIELD